jgi:hypothetical protein
MTALEDLGLHDTEYVQALEDALNAYDAWVVALFVTNQLGAAECYDTMHRCHGGAIARAITNSISRNSSRGNRGNKTST